MITCEKTTPVISRDLNKIQRWDFHYIVGNMHIYRLCQGTRIVAHLIVDILNLIKCSVNCKGERAKYRILPHPLYLNTGI